jgi:hypothetical protein
VAEPFSAALAHTTMQFIGVVLTVLAWLVLQRWLLPRFGVPT